MSQPYTDLVVTDEFVIREFDENIDPIELMWHKDLEERKVIVIEGKNWYYQQDNQLPIELKQDIEIFIPRLVWHRVIKGIGKLKIKIYKS